MPNLPRTFFQPVRGRVAGYSVALALVVIATLVRSFADHLLPPGFPFLTFFPAVIITTFLAGRGPGWLCAGLSLLSSWYFFIPPANTFVVSAPVATALLFFTGVVVVDVLLIDGLQQRQQRLVESQQQLAAMAEQQSLLFQELQHRVANNLASVSSMLRIQRRQIERTPEIAIDVMESADRRIELMGRVHRQLYHPSARETPLPDQIRSVVAQAQDVAGAAHVAVTVEAIDAPLAVDRMLTLMLLITEVVNNSIKHAFPEGTPGEVRLVLERCGERRLRLTIADNGRGLPAAADAAQGQRGLGTAITKGFANQLGGTIKVDGSKGVTTVVEFAEG